MYDLFDMEPCIMTSPRRIPQRRSQGPVSRCPWIDQSSGVFPNFQDRWNQSLYPELRKSAESSQRRNGKKAPSKEIMHYFEVDGNEAIARVPVSDGVRNENLCVDIEEKQCRIAVSYIRRGVQSQTRKEKIIIPLSFLHLNLDELSASYDAREHTLILKAPLLTRESSVESGLGSEIEESSQDDIAEPEDQAVPEADSSDEEKDKRRIVIEDVGPEENLDLGSISVPSSAEGSPKDFIRDPDPLY